MRSSIGRAWALIAVCGTLAACAGTGVNSDYTAVSCSTPGAVRESPFNSTANPTEGPLPRAPGDFPCYIPGNSGQPAIASTSDKQRTIAAGEAAGDVSPR
jgi:hypothetical protein